MDKFLFDVSKWVNDALTR